MLNGGRFRRSQNDYDWLGEGIYFWEYGLDRAWKFAEFQKKFGKVTDAAVIGAVIQLGDCFDLMDTKYTDELSSAYPLFKASRPAKEPLPKNTGRYDKKLRRLDCAVLNFYLKALEENSQTFDTVRCAFLEGNAVFRGSGIRKETHIQVAVRNPAAILGVFKPC